MRQKSGRRGPRRPDGGQDVVRIYGRHAVMAALANPRRRVLRLDATPEGRADLSRPLPDGTTETLMSAAELARFVPDGAPHQGLVLTVAPLPPADLDAILAGRNTSPAPLLFLDQVTDPHNVGAIIRSAAAFGALALVTQDRHSPLESGTLARAASGALEILPWVRATNLARALDRVAEAGYWRIGLAGDAGATLADALPGRAVALVIGSEGKGLRQNVRQHCDALARLPIRPEVESLNASNAAAIALYACSARPVAQ